MAFIEGVTIRVRGAIGSTIYTAIEECVEMAKEYNSIVSLIFNGTEINISKNDTVENKVAEYFDGR